MSKNYFEGFAVSNHASGPWIDGYENRQEAITEPDLDVDDEEKPYFIRHPIEISYSSSENIDFAKY